MTPQACYNTAVEVKMYKGPTIGYCHICREVELIEFCSLCEHWICLGCQGRFFSRGLAFVKDLLKGSDLDCCGPIAKVA